MTDALTGITILDLTSHITGPYATKVLADLGARVIKVERPGGDPARQLGPFLHDQPGPERSATFQFLNTNKESLVLDLTQEEARAVVYELARQADLVVTSFPPAVAERLSMDPSTLREQADVPVLAITNFGRTGPYRDYQLSDTVLFAMGGEMFSHGIVAREPLKLGGTAALLQCGAMGAIAALGAIHAWEQHHVGQTIELALFDVQINNIDRRSSAILGFRWTGRILQRPPAAGGGVIGGVYPAADGYVEVTAGAGSYWQRLVEMIDDDRLREAKWQDPAWMINPAAKEEAEAIVYPWMLSRTRHEVWEAARRSLAMVAPIYTARDLFDDPVLRERGLWTEIEHAVLGRLPMIGRPYILDRTPWRIRNAAPLLGEHTEPILRRLGLDHAHITAIVSAEVPA
jgi:crotonobetainyl-CoA:carnitine CoA-transferase CaiB-like acyl-CoA transferase